MLVRLLLDPKLNFTIQNIRICFENHRITSNTKTYSTILPFERRNHYNDNLNSFNTLHKNVNYTNATYIA